jgi:hypothetical protein
VPGSPARAIGMTPQSAKGQQRTTCHG